MYFFSEEVTECVLVLCYIIVKVYVFKIDCVFSVAYVLLINTIITIITESLWHRSPMASIASSMHPSMTSPTMKPEPSQAPYSNIMEGYFNHASQVSRNILCTTLGKRKLNRRNVLTILVISCRMMHNLIQYAM